MGVGAGEGAPVVEIGIDPAAQARLAFLYAAVAAEELSDRVLGLTQQVNGCCPPRYRYCALGYPSIAKSLPCMYATLCVTRSQQRPV